jgi:hypothetical protein
MAVARVPRALPVSKRLADADEEASPAFAGLAIQFDTEVGPKKKEGGAQPQTESRRFAQLEWIKVTQSAIHISQVNKPYTVKDADNREAVLVVG